MRQYRTIGDIRSALQNARNAAATLAVSVKPGLLLDEDDLLPLIEGIEKREAYIRRVKDLAKQSRDVNALVKAIEEKV